jgi:hypothetical protein
LIMIEKVIGPGFAYLAVQTVLTPVSNFCELDCTMPVQAPGPDVNEY